VYEKNLSQLDLLPVTIRSNAIKSLIVYSKYCGVHEQFKSNLKRYAIKPVRADALASFLRIMNSKSSDVVEWYHSILSSLRSNEQLWSKYLLYSGLRLSESIASFNLIIELSRAGKLSDYYNEELGCLCHFKFPRTFIRKTKNCYITFVQPQFIEEIANSQPITYNMIRKRLSRKGIAHLRFNEFRDYFGTVLVSNGINEIEQNLCCGRIPVSIFIRHYWSPKLAELRERVFKALESLDVQQQQMVIAQ